MRSARPDPGILAYLRVLGASALMAAITGSAVFAQTPPPAGAREVVQPAPGAPPGSLSPGTPQRNTRNVPTAIAPTVLKVEPLQVVAGQSYALSLTGMLFQQGMQFDFGTGIAVEPKTLRLIDASHARVAVQVAAGTPAGQHLVTASIVVPTPGGPGTPIKNQGPGFVMIAAPVTSALVLERVLPASVQQGAATTLTLEGSGFSAGMSVSFGPGISASGPVEVQSGAHATLAIRVAAQAPPMLRHPTVLITGRDVKVASEASLTVTAMSAVVPPVPAPISYASVSVLLAVSPARLFTGGSYTLTLRGLNLVPQLTVDLGPGITVKSGLRVQSPSLATVDVTVGADAAGGMRWLGLQLPSALTPVRQDASVLVQRGLLAAHGFAPKPSECKPPQVAHQGTIVLDGPLYSDQYNTVTTVYSVPVLNDETDLSWHEANAGLADRFEVRFYSGSTLVATRVLTAKPGYALPHDLKPDDSLIATLTQGVSGRVGKIVNVNVPPSQPPSSVNWDLTWQVVGLHTFYDSCASATGAVGPNGVHLARETLGAGKELEVEHSEVVPIKQPQTGDPLLDLPDAPTGLTCNSAPAAAQPGFKSRQLRSGETRESGSQGPSNQTNLSLSNIDRQSQANGPTQTADYTYDHWQLGGTLDLSASPWTLATAGSVPSGSPKSPLMNETVNNVYVDWGDGTVEPLTVQWQGQECGNNPCFVSNTETSSASLFSLDQATNRGAFLHPYSQVGSYDVRVYVLPGSNAAQQGALPASIHAGAGGLYGKLLNRVGQGSAGGSAEDALAYMLFCQTVNIQPRTDPATNGKLQLKSISVVGFPAAPASGSARAVKAEAGAQAMTSKPIAKLPAASPSPTAAKTLTAGEGGAAGLARGLSPGGAAGGPPLPQFSSCDANLVGGATLKFVGEGTAHLTWYEDGQAVGSSDEPIGPSLPRTQQQLAPPPPPSFTGPGLHLVPVVEPVPPVVTDWPGLQSPDLSLAQMGKHELMVTAEVETDLHPTGRVLDALGELAGNSHAMLAGPGAGVGKATAPGAGSLSVSASAALVGAPPLGLLGPKGAAASGLPPIAWVGRAPAGAPGTSLNLSLGARGAMLNGGLQGNPPDAVVSAPVAYQVTAADPTEPCTFNFPVQGGDKFVIAGLQHGGKASVQQQGGSYSGTGVLQARFAEASGTATQVDPVTIQFQGWTMQGDGVTVAQGTFAVTPPARARIVPGISMTPVKFEGTAGDQVTATLDASLSNTDIPPANGGATPAWKAVKATLTPKGDWISGALPIPQLLVYDSGFLLTAQSATLDLSQSQGQAANTAYCIGQGGANWMGVLLNQAQLTAFSFDLKNPLAVSINGWGIDSYGLCGQAQFPAKTFPVDQGSLSWSSVTAQASNGSFNASYSGLNVRVPWLNTTFSSSQATQQLTAGAGAGQGGIMLKLDTPSKVTLNEGPITLTATHLSFGSQKAAGGWTVRSDTSFNFASQQGQFASNVMLHGFDYAMSGAAAFEDGTSSRHLDLGGQHGNIGGSLVDLKSVDVQVAPASSPTRVAFAFDTTLNLSKTLPAADVPVSYNVTQSGQTYTGNGPVTSPFKLDKPFPDANPSVHLSMTPTYVGGGASRSSSGVLFSSDLQLGMFGGPPVSGQFVLGYVGSDDYWLARALLDLGPTGVVVVPLIINLYKIGGGMGYNVSLASFQYQDLTQAQPQDDGTLLFDATLLIGSPDHTSFGLNGDFVIKPGGQDPGGRMDYHAWLLDPDWSGQSPIWGHFSFSGGMFDGTLNAQFNELGGQVAIDALNDAIHMHVGGGQWYFHLGTQSNPLNGQLFFYHGQTWADIGSDGFGLGLIARLDLDAGDCSSACGYIHDDWMVMAAISLSPVSFSTSGSESFSLGACAAGFCINANASASVALSLPPPYLDFNFHLGGCPPGHIDVGIQVLPSLNPNVGGGVCTGL
ncbi:MAG: hypothetical protein WAN26_04870 [Steroidobacteraceae bacterium]